MTGWMRSLLAVIAAVTLLSCAAAWVLPIEAVQGWSIRRAGDDPYAQFEASGQAEALTWLARIILPVALVVVILAWRRAEPAARFCSAAFDGFRRATLGAAAPIDLSTRFRTLCLRAFIALWLVLFAWRFGAGVLQRGRDWAYFRFNSGAEVLPNMSFENRDVIRYVRDSTPDDVRILACSDQSVHFLSYYLLPRRVFHFIHPDAEFVIPQPGRARPLEAYRLSDLSPGDLAAVHPDYVLEYFEGAKYLPDDLAADNRWMEFRRSHGDSGPPPYFVRLSRYRPHPPPSGAAE